MASSMALKFKPFTGLRHSTPMAPEKTGLTKPTSIKINTKVRAAITSPKLRIMAPRGGRGGKKGSLIRETVSRSTSEEGEGSGRMSQSHTKHELSQSSTGSSRIPRLDPLGDTWFRTDGHVTRAVTDCMEESFDSPYVSWKKVPEDVRQHWFNTFKGKYTWDLANEFLIRKEFNSTCQRRLKGMVYDVSIKFKQTGKPPEFMTPQVWEDFQAKRNTDDFKAKSAIAKANRKKAGDSKAHFGSSSAAEHAKKMTKERQGHIIPAPDLFYHKHSVANNDGTRTLTSLKANDIWRQYNEMLQELDERGVANPDVNEVFYEVIGGYNKGHLYGVGSAAHMYYGVSHPYPTR